MRSGFRAGLATGLAVGGLVGFGAGIEFGLHLLVGLLLLGGLTAVTATLAARSVFRRKPQPVPPAVAGDSRRRGVG